MLKLRPMTRERSRKLMKNHQLGSETPATISKVVYLLLFWISGILLYFIRLQLLNTNYLLVQFPFFFSCFGKKSEEILKLID